MNSSNFLTVMVDSWYWSSTLAMSFWKLSVILRVEKSRSNSLITIISLTALDFAKSMNASALLTRATVESLRIRFLVSFWMAVNSSITSVLTALTILNPSELITESANWKLE